jgi:hypothetical protein
VEGFVISRFVATGFMADGFPVFLVAAGFFFGGMSKVLLKWRIA